MPKEPFKIVFDAINQNVDAFPENQAEDVIFVCYWMDYTSFFLLCITVHYCRMKTWDAALFYKGMRIPT